MVWFSILSGLVAFDPPDELALILLEFAGCVCKKSTSEAFFPKFHQLLDSPPSAARTDMRSHNL